ncbi:MAG: hypothetical protein N3B12_08535, partial [Armatimonadetes bacterium]|nr:hypothetical protein [Armatimonadota bacterium]
VPAFTASFSDCVPDYDASATILLTFSSLSSFAIDIAEANITNRLVATFAVTLDLPRTPRSSNIN